MDAKSANKRKADVDAPEVDEDAPLPLAKRLRSCARVDEKKEVKSPPEPRRLITGFSDGLKAIDCRCAFCNGVFELDAVQGHREAVGALEAFQKSLEGEDRLKLCESALGLYQYAKVAQRIDYDWGYQRQDEYDSRLLLERALRPFIGIYIPNEYGSHLTAVSERFGEVSLMQRWEILKLYDRTLNANMRRPKLSAVVCGCAVIVRGDHVETRILHIRSLFNAEQHEMAMDAIQWAQIFFSDDPDALNRIKRELEFWEEETFGRQNRQLRRTSEDPKVRENYHGRGDPDSSDSE